MFACCHLCYEKYIEPDKTIDLATYNSIKAEYLNTRRDNPRYDKIEKSLSKICDCDCHIKGLCVMH